MVKEFLNMLALQGIERVHVEDVVDLRDLLLHTPHKSGQALSTVEIEEVLVNACKFYPVGVKCFFATVLAYARGDSDTNISDVNRVLGEPLEFSPSSARSEVLERLALTGTLVSRYLRGQDNKHLREDGTTYVGRLKLPDGRIVALGVELEEKHEVRRAKLVLAEHIQIIPGERYLRISKEPFWYDDEI